jgi:hypothetical protein
LTTPRPSGAYTRRAVIFAAFLALLTEGQAYAYLDPGAVSFFFQTLVAGLLGGLLVIKRYWQQIKSALSKLFSPQARDDRD